MDYGQSSQSNNAGFGSAISSGSGNENQNINNSGDSLNDTWYFPTSNRDPRNVGSSAVISSSQEIPQTQQTGDIINSYPQQINSETAQENPSSDQLGEVINLEMPPGSQFSDTGTKLESQEPFNASAIKTTEKLGKTGIKEVDKALMRFREDGDAATFYQTAREMMTKNLINSYGENAAWKGDKAA